MVWLEITGWFLVVGGFIVICRNMKHLLAVFIGLEMMSLGVLFMSHVLFVGQIWSVYLVLCLAVCEAAICLALLVMVMRSCGSDYMSSLSAGSGQ